MLSRFLVVVGLSLWALTSMAEVPIGWRLEGEAKDLLAQEDFEAIDAVVQGFLETDEPRTPSGAWKLGYFYNGLKGYFKGDTSDPAYWQDFDERTAAFLRAKPESSAAAILRAHYYYELAWFFRGGTSSKDVPDEAWESFFENLHLGQSTLFSYEELFKNDPEWFAQLILIQGSLSARSDGFFSIVDEALSLFPAYQRGYIFAARFTEKRWSGDPDLIDRFARYVAANSSETEGAGAYVRIYYRMWMLFSHRSNMFLNFSPDWGLMKESMRDVLVRFPTEGNLQEFGLIACMKDDAEFGAEIFAQIKEPPIEAIWSGQFTFDQCSQPNFGRITVEDVARDISIQWLFDTMLALGYEPLPVNR